MKKATRTTQTHHVARSKNKPAHGRTNKRFQRFSAHLRIPLACLVALALIVPALGYATPPDILDLPTPSDIPATPEDNQTSSTDENNTDQNTPANPEDPNTNEGSADPAPTEEQDKTNASDDQSATKKLGFSDAPGYILSLDPTAEIDPALYAGEAEGESNIATTSIDPDNAADMQVLVENRFTGLTPANTTVNLYDYSSFIQTTGTPVIPTGSDEQTSSAEPSAWLGSSTNPSINTGHALTFGNGMNNNMGYWNAGSGSGQGAFSFYTPGFQNIVQPTLGSDGYPQLSADSMVVNGEAKVPTFSSDSYTVNDAATWPEVGGYNNNPPLYADAKRFAAPGQTLPSWARPGTSLFADAGGKNISDAVQNQWDKNLSLGYLFDPDSTAAGRTQTHTDVQGLFQIDAQGYYYYNMRENFAQYTADAVQGKDGTIPANSFILYDEPAGFRTDGQTPTSSVGNFFPFNTGEQVFKVEDGKLVNDIYSTNNGAAGTASNNGQGKPLVDHHLGLSMDTTFRQPVGGKVGSNDMTFEFIGDDDL